MPVFAKQLGTLNYASPESIKIIANHIRSMQEQLEYRLSCLDSSNISEINMDETSIISKDGSLISILNSYGDEIAGITVNYDSINAAVVGLDNEISALELRADRITATVSSQGQSISQLQLKSNSISATVADLETGLASALRLDSTGVYITDQDGNMVSITGSNIASKAITVDKLKLYGTLDIYSSTSYALIGGHLGYAKSLQNGAAGMQMASSNRYYVDPVDGSSAMTGMYGEVGVTNSGVRMAHRYKNVSSGVERLVYISVYGTDGTTPAANVSVNGVAYEFYADIFRTREASALGSSTYRWGQIYTTAAVNTTSDRNAKNSIEYDIDPRYDVLWSLLKPCTGKYNDGTSGRTHMFLVAQDVEEAVEEAGLNSLDFAAYSKSPREGEDGNIIEGYTYGLRYEEFIPLCIRHIQLLEARVAKLERS